MVQQQLRTWNVSDQSVLRVISELQREQFVPAGYEDLAFADTEIPLPHGQTMMKPIVEGRLLQALELKSEHNVLEIGTGSAYQAAVLAELCKEVYSIEIVEALANRARADLERLGYHNIQVRQGDGYRGWPEAAPFDAIVVTAAPSVWTASAVQLFTDSPSISTTQAPH